MNKEFLNKFKTLFEEQKREILERAQKAPAEFNISTDDMSDEVDLTSAELQNSMQMRLRSREALLLKKIDEALGKIHAGTFGECESCGDDIGQKRLEARPTASLCIQCKEEEERREHMHIDGHRHKSLGTKLRLLA